MPLSSSQAAFVLMTPTGSVSGGVSGATGAAVANATGRIVNSQKHETHSTRPLQFRTDFFSVLHEVNLGNPNAPLTNTNLGKITSAAAPRHAAVRFEAHFLSRTAPP